MENASKALLIAGAVLIGILLINVWTLLSSSFKGVSESHATKFSTEEKQKYNNQILKNITSDNEITAQGILTIVNLNKEKEIGITIIIENTICNYSLDKKANQSKFLKENSIDITNPNNPQLKYYEVPEEDIKYTDGLISKITIKS